MMRTVTTVVVFGLIIMVSSVLFFVNFWSALACFLILTILFVKNGIKNIPANPPHKGVLTFIGKRQRVVLKEGWNFLPLYPVIFNVILVKVEKVNYDLEPQRVRTPDRAEISVTTSVTWTPGIEETPESYINYLNSGGEAGVKKIIHDVIEDRIKTWAGSNKEGPSSWMEAQALKDDAHEVLTKSLLGNVLEPIGNPIPTNTWMRFLEEPQSEPTEYDSSPRNGWAFKGDSGLKNWNWDGLQAIYVGYTEDERKDLKSKIGKRRDAIRSIREGKGEFGDESLGITINRFTINDLRVEGEVAKAAELEEKERRERAADKMEIANVSKRIQKLRKENPEMSLEDAVRIVQTERGKISKTVIEVLGASTGLGQDVLAGLGLQRMPNGGGGVASSGSGEKQKKPDNPPGMVI